MPRQLSAAAFREMFAQESGDAFLTCLTLEHPSFSPLRVVYNNETIYRDGVPPAGSAPVTTGESQVTGSEVNYTTATTTEERYYTEFTIETGSDYNGRNAAVKWKVVIYNDTTRALFYTSPEFTGVVTNGKTTVPVEVTLPAGTWRIGVHLDRAINLKYADGAPGASWHTGTPTDTYSDGPEATMTTDVVMLTEERYMLLSGKHAYQPALFNIGLPAEVEGQIPEIQLSIDNVDRAITDLITSVQGRVKVTLEVVLGSDPNDVQFGPAEFYLMSADFNAEVVTGSLSLEDDVLNTEFPKSKYTPWNSAGMFK